MPEQPSFFDGLDADLLVKATRFHEDHPLVYAKVREYAFQAQAAGLTHFGIGAIFERVRWFCQVETHGDEFKLNNNYRAFYVRLLMEREPRLRSFFETRTSMFDRGRDSLGPRSAPPGPISEPRGPGRFP